MDVSMLSMPTFPFRASSSPPPEKRNG